MITTRETLQTTDLLWANDYEMTRFKKQVYSNSNELTILVHPFFEEHTQMVAVYPMASDYQENLDRLLKEHLDQDKPLVIFEEEGKCHFLNRRIVRRMKEVVGTLYYIETQKNSSLLSITSFWPRLMDIFSHAYVNKISIAGQYMFFFPGETCRRCPVDCHQDIKEFADHLLTYRGTNLLTDKYLKQDLVPGGCAGTLVRSLSMEGFNISISPASSPLKIINLPRECILL